MGSFSPVGRDLEIATLQEIGVSDWLQRGFSPVGRDLEIATRDRIAGCSHIRGCFSPVGRDLEIATQCKQSQESLNQKFQSRRPGFGDCDNGSYTLNLNAIAGFSPVGRDLEIATFSYELIDSANFFSFSPVGRDLEIATRRLTTLIAC